MRRSCIIPLWLIMSGILTQNVTIAQINISPTFLMIEENTGINELYVHNGSEDQQEVRIRFLFGYPSADNEGRTIMVYNDDDMEKQYGLSDYIRVFPQRFIIAPGQTQTVIVQVRPMQQRSDGVYFTRAVVSSNILSKDIDKRIDDEINMQINYVLNQNIPVMYRKGNTKTGLAIRGVDYQFSDDGLVVIKKLSPTGNAPFNGTVSGLIRNSFGDVVAQQQQVVVAYFEVLRRLSFQLPEEGLPAGDYSLELTYKTIRRDISPGQLVQAPALNKHFSFHIE